jgi:NADH:ubiquinone oxidoreductase subunit K
MLISIKFMLFNSLKLNFVISKKVLTFLATKIFKLKLSLFKLKVLSTKFLNFIY